jgi:hypothetical protein
MKEAIKYLQTLSIKCDKSGNIISKLPEGEKGITLVNMLEEATMKEDYCFTIINNKIEKIEC